jgi:hypothetical protein
MELPELVQMEQCSLASVELRSADYNTPCIRHALKIFEPEFDVFHPPRRLLPSDQRATYAPLESDTSVGFHPINAQLQSKPSSREC